VYPLQADRSAFFLEKAFTLVAPGGVVALCQAGRFLRGAAGAPLRELLLTRRIDEIVDLAGLPAGTPGAGLVLLRTRATRPAQTFLAATPGLDFFRDPAGAAARSRFPVSREELDAGGWVLRDTRREKILAKVRQHGTPLVDVVMGEVHAGIRIADDDPHIIPGTLARVWIRRDSRYKPLLRPLLSARPAGTAAGLPEECFLILIPRGWTQSHAKAEKKPWQWFRHRYPLIARHLQASADLLKERAGPNEPWWEIACDEFWQEPQKKILVAQDSAGRPEFRPDPGRGIADDTLLAIPSSGLYLAGLLSSRLMGFVIDQIPGTVSGTGRILRWDDLGTLPVYTPDLDRPEDRARYDRIETLEKKKSQMQNSCRHAKTAAERGLLETKIRPVSTAIDTIVYDLYGLTPDEIAVVEGSWCAHHDPGSPAG
ncbi:MAG: hypothetical protein GYA23_05835, partial [Methanomicrobiales archaeon]|nr:hypothetical protein [Methanomicrobiales archaeon]